MRRRNKSDLLIIANKEKAILADELVTANENYAEHADELIKANEDKEERAAELIIANEDKAELAAELVIAGNEKSKLADELILAHEEKDKRAAELVVANRDKEKRAAELIIANVEKGKRAAELIIANKEKEKRADELVIANKEKAKRSAELIVANAEKAKRSAELVIANAEKAKRAAGLVISNLEKASREDELIIADKELAYQNEERVKRAAELVIADINKTKLEAELVIANIEKAKRIAISIIVEKELSYQTTEKSKRAAELVIADAAKAKLEAELVIANIKKAKRSAELVIANVEKAKRSAELVIANKELVYQKSEKAKRAAELVIANVEKAKRSAELVIANIEKAKRAAESVITNKELVLAKEKEKLVAELTLVNKELMLQINERKLEALELIKAKEKAEESDRLKSSFLTNMSHEIRTPMNGILGFTELLKEPNLTSDDQMDFIHTIQISGARMLNTINSIVDVAKIESGLIKADMKETDINEKIEFTYKFFKQEAVIKGLRLTVKNHLHAREAIIITDSEKVYAILTNLVKNAIKFTNEGSVEIGCEKKGAYLEFYVRDTGIGIPILHRELIFERFRQGSESLDRNYEGSGLGLSIAKSYVKMLGGDIWVESERGKGSTFYFTIPFHAILYERNERKVETPEKLNEAEIKNLKILIVEDDEISQSLLTWTLQNISSEILHAVTGKEAIETCRNNPDLDLVLMDIRMPGMDGNEATRQIRKFNKEIVIIAQTAYAFSGDRENALQAGCNDYISKPVNKKSLLELINKQCNNQRENNATTP